MADFLCTVISLVAIFSLFGYLFYPGVSKKTESAALLILLLYFVSLPIASFIGEIREGGASFPSYEGIEELLPLVDILIPSAEFAMGITGKSTPREAILALNERYAPSVLAVTDGENGGYYIEDGKAVHYDSFKIDPIDTNGAGDTFHGAFISEYLCGSSIAECCRFASAVSAYKCIHSGVREFPLTRDIIHEFISKNG